MERSNSSTAKNGSLLGRLAGAPISWGVCEVPGWGVQLPAARVLAELEQVGFKATELGPRGFLPEDPARLRELLSGHGLRVIAGFVPAMLHDPARRERELEGVRASARELRAAGAEMLVLAAATGDEGYERGSELSDAAWRSLVDGIAACETVAAEHGLGLALHPHYGTVVESQGQVERLLASSPVGICLDVGHLAVGGADAVEVARRAGSRVRHVHLKDVNAAIAARVRAGELGYQEAVGVGLYTTLGAGAARIGEIVRLLEGAGYTGWYVLEHDVVLAEVPAVDAGPARDARRSLDFLRTLAA